MTTSTTVYSAAAVDDQLAAQAASVAATYLTQAVGGPRLAYRLPNGTRAAHATGTTYAPEDTLAGAHLSLSWGTQSIEFDVQITSDQVPVVMHDATVDRMTNGTGTISQMTLAAIQALTIDAGSNVARYPNQPVPTVAQMLDLCTQFSSAPTIDLGKLQLLSDFQAVAAVIRAKGYEYVASMLVDINYIDIARRVFPYSTFHAYGDPNMQSTIDRSVQYGADAICYEKASWNSAVVATVHAAGLRASGYAYFQAADIATATAMGIDLFTVEGAAIA